MSNTSSSGQGFTITSLKELVIYQLGLISRTSANMLFIDEQQRMVGISPTDSFYMAVRTLDDYLIGVWDVEYRGEKEKALAEKDNVAQSAHMLLQAGMKLIHRARLLINMVDIDV